jgi:thermitase
MAVTDAWKINSGDKNILVAVLDSGINGGHEDLAGKVVKEVNFSDSPVVNDLYGHGTHIAGIIAANANNKLGIAGMAYSCRLLNVKVAGDNGRYNVFSLAKGITWAADNGANVINMSLYSTTPSRELEAAVKYAWSKGVVMVAAAGNSKGVGRVYPASYENCIPVAATDENGRIADWSNYGNWVHIAAPGEHIISTVVLGYEYKSGSSMAAAYVSGLAALLAASGNSNGDRLSNTSVKQTIEKRCITLSEGNRPGRVNALRALQTIKGDKDG